MTAEVLAFLSAHPGRIAIFEAFASAVDALGESQMAVTKSQISWGNPKKFAFLSLPLRAGKGWPPEGLIFTFGLGFRLDHPRVFQAVEPYPGRWTHHVVLGCPGDVDGDVEGFLAQSYEFSLHKRRRK